MTYFDLNRRFVERKTYQVSELIAADITGRRVGWPDVLSATPCVVIAPANFGKTTEMKERARLLRQQSERAVFIALRRVADRNGVERAIDGDDLADFRAWKAAPTSRLTLFVDSLDEAASNQREGIDNLVSMLADAVSWPNDSVRWVISTRPAVLTDGVLDKLKELLCRTTETSLDPSDETTGAALSSESSTTTETSTTEVTTTLRVFSMAPLNTVQATTYVRGRYPHLPADKVLHVAHERGLSGFTSSPGGLDILSNIDLLTNPPTSLTEVFGRVAGAMQMLRSRDGRIGDVAAGLGTELESTARRLASATQLCQLMNIEMPTETLAVSSDALSARLIGAPALNEPAITQLLNTQLFIDVGFHQVKIYPDELTPFLAAQRLSELAQSPEQAHQLIQNFAWSAPSGQQGVHRHLLPTLGWLATLNPHCRRVLLDVDPQTLALFGDLRNENVPLQNAKDALTETFRRQVEQGDEPGRGIFNLTSENYWQAGAERLAPVVAELYDKYGEHHWARDTLMHMVTAARSGVLRDRILKRHKGDYKRLLLDAYDARYLVELENSVDLSAMAKALKGSKDVRDSTVSMLLSRLGWSHFSPEEAARLVVRQLTGESDGFSTGFMLDSSDFLPTATDGQLYKFCRGIVIKLPKVVQDGQDLDRYLEKTIETVATLVKRPAQANEERTALLCLVLHERLTELSLTTEKSSIFDALRGNDGVRRQLLKLITGRQGRTNGQLMMAAVGYDRMCNYTADDVASVGDARLSQLYAEYMAHATTVAPRHAAATRRRVAREPAVIDSARQAWLKERQEELVAGASNQATSWLVNWLSSTTAGSRYGDVDFESFERQVDSETAEAARKGLAKLWRKNNPLFNENSTHSTSLMTAAGLQGLHIELGSGATLPALSDAQVRRALRYAMFEINGYPKWFWPLVSAYQGTAIDEFKRMVARRKKGFVSQQHADKLLTANAEAPQAVRDVLVRLAWDYLQGSPEPSAHLTEGLLISALEQPSIVGTQEFEEAALKKIQAAFNAKTLDGPADSKLNAKRAEAVMWAGRWLTTYPAGFTKAISSWGPKDGHAVKLFLANLAAHIGRDRSGSMTKLAGTSNDGIVALEKLCLWVQWAVDPADDVQRPEGVSYSPGPRDNAERMRDSIVLAIASATSQQAYDALVRLEAASPEGLFKQYIPRVMFGMRERQFLRPPIPQRGYDEFERSLQSDVTDSLSFAMAVHSDLLAVKYDIERGEHSLRNFLSAIDFTRVNKPGDVGKKAGLALEADFQRLLGSELNHHARNRYSVALEPETAERKRRDVLCSRNEWRASIELKMSERWTLADYVEALEKQLVNQYMRHRNATTGFLVIVLQTKNRKWMNPSTGKTIYFPEVLDVLSKHAQALEAKDGRRYLRVIGIDSTPMEDFRKKPAGKKGAAVTSTNKGRKPPAKKASARRKAP